MILDAAILILIKQHDLDSRTFCRREFSGNARAACAFIECNFHLVRFSGGHFENRLNARLCVTGIDRTSSTTLPGGLVAFFPGNARR